MAVRKKTAVKAQKIKKNAAGKQMMAKAKPTSKKSPTRARVASATKAKDGSLNFPATPITQKQSKAQIYAEIADITNMGKSDVKKFFAALKNLLERHLKGKGLGEFIVPELGIKVRRIHKSATKSRMGRNPFTGEEIQIPAKPARKSVKASALKALKEIVLA